jgi:hypothetical protein
VLLASFAQCIDIAYKNGRITKDIADLIKLSDDPNAAIDNLLGELTRNKREAAIQAVRIAQRYDDIKSHPDGMMAGLMATMTKDTRQKAGYKNVDYLANYYTSKYSSKLADVLSKYRTRMFGFSQDEEGLEKMIRAIYGEDVGDPEISKFAKDWLDVTEEIRQTFNARGGSISKNESWLLPQNHDATAIKKVGLEQWKAKIRPMLDESKMFTDEPYQFTDAASDQVDEALNAVYETITTHGLNKVKEFSSPRLGKKLSRRGGEQRFLYFKDADSWLSYQREFGRGDIFTTLTDHISQRSHDIALMELFGTNPDAAFNGLLARIRTESDVSGYQLSFANSVWNVVSGKLSRGDMVGLADFMQTTRNVLTASTLGKAFLSAISDTGFQAITSMYNGVPAMRVFKRIFSQMNPANEADRIFAVKIGLGAEAWLGRAMAANRYSDVYGTGMSTKIAEGVMRFSLLQPWTDAGQKAFTMEFSSFLAENFGKSLNELDDPLQRQFAAYGITEADWNLFRKSKTLDYKGAKFADMTQDGGVKFHQMIMTERDYAVPVPDSRVRAITTGGYGRGTVGGQIMRTIMNLKTFPITIATTHLYRMAFQATTGQKLQYGGFLMASTTALGGVALLAKDFAAGREPREVDEKFLAAAIAQGGGVGIFGDYVFSDVNRFGQGPVSSAFGPTGELAEKFISLTLGNAQEALKGEETNILGESVRFVERYTPDTWQTHLFKNAFFDQIEMMADPEAQRRYNRMMRKRMREYNQDYWWKPGEPLPEALQ